MEDFHQSNEMGSFFDVHVSTRHKRGDALSEQWRTRRCALVLCNIRVQSSLAAPLQVSRTRGTILTPEFHFVGAARVTNRKPLTRRR